MADWYYQIGGTEIGPVSAVELGQKVDDGTITPVTLVRHATRSWVPAAQVGGLFGAQHLPTQATPTIPATHPALLGTPSRQPCFSHPLPAPVVHCPFCHQAMAASPELAGQLVACPYCSQQLVMPGQSQVIAQFPQTTVANHVIVNNVMSGPPPSEAYNSPFAAVLAGIAILAAGIFVIQTSWLFGVVILSFAVIAPFLVMLARSGACPYCGQEISTRMMRGGGITCTACHHRIVLRNNRFHGVN